jgi:hypothetical protein
MSGSNSSRPAAAAPLDEPLGLTVHSMPSPQALNTPQRTVSGRWKMLAVLLVCAAPVIASYFTYYVIRPEGRRSYGELIEPQRPVPQADGVALDGKAVPLASLRNQWLLVSVGPAACDAGCEKNLYFQRQLRETLGREKDRLDRVWLVTDEAPVREALLPALKGAQVLRVAPSVLSQWLSPAQGHELKAHLYVVDPMGNWMMRFPADMDVAGAARAKRDLDRLLRASASWDQEGRPEAGR